MQQHPLFVSTDALLYTNLIGSGSLARAIFITERLPSLSEKNSLWRKKEGREKNKLRPGDKDKGKGGRGEGDNNNCGGGGGTGAIGVGSRLKIYLFLREEGAIFLSCCLFLQRFRKRGGAKDTFAEPLSGTKIDPLFSLHIPPHLISPPPLSLLQRPQTAVWKLEEEAFMHHSWIGGEEGSFH